MEDGSQPSKEQVAFWFSPYQYPRIPMHLFGNAFGSADLLSEIGLLHMEIGRVKKQSEEIAELVSMLEQEDIISTTRFTWVRGAGETLIERLREVRDKREAHERMEYGKNGK